MHTLLAATVNTQEKDPTQVPHSDEDGHYRSLFNSIDQGFCVIEMIFDERGHPRDYLFIEVNPAFEQHTGLVAAAGRRIREMVPTQDQHWFDIYGKVATTGEPLRFESFGKALSRWFSVYAFRFGNAESRKVALLFTDITLRKQIDERTQFLSGLSQDLASATTEQEIIAMAVQAVGTHLRTDRCYFLECLEADNLVILSHNWLSGRSPSIAGRFNLFDFGGIKWWSQFLSGNFAVEDTETDPLTRDKAADYAAIGVRSYAVQPFRREGKWTVMLAVTEDRPRHWSAEELSLLEDVVARVWPLVERARGDQALRASEEFNRTVLESSPDCIKILDGEGRLQFMNSAGLCLMEIDDFAPLCNQEWADLWGDANRARVQDAVELALKGKPAHFQALCPTAKGNLKWWDVMVAPVAHTKDAGPPEQLVSVSRDITESKRAEEALRKSEARFRAIVSQATTGVFQADAGGRTQLVNQRWCEMLGYSEAELLRMDVTDFVYSESLPEIVQGLERLAKGGRSFVIEHCYERKDGSVFWASSSVNAVRGPDGEFQGSVAVVLDVSERRKAVEHLRQAKEQAETASRAKDDFLAALSHELRTPLNPVLMTASVLREDETLAPPIREQLAMIERNIALEARLIDDLLDLTRISRGKLALRAEPCEIHSLIELVVEMVQEEARERKIEIALDLAAQRSSLQGDPTRLQQVFWNLLRNAVKFTTFGGHILIRSDNAFAEPDAAGMSESRIRIEVIDDGIGLDAAQTERIFEPFEQILPGKEQRSTGLGLGLGIARAIVNLHRGTIRAESAGPGCGSTFIVELPGAKIPQGKTSAAADSTSIEPASQVSMRLLVVEDHEPTLQVLTRLLARAGHQVVPVVSLAKARAAAALHRFDAVLSDLGLPDGTGIELMDELRAIYGLRGIMLSGYGMDEDIRRSRDAGFVAHLVKPVDIHELRRALLLLGSAS